MIELMEMAEKQHYNYYELWYSFFLEYFIQSL